MNTRDHARCDEIGPSESGEEESLAQLTPVRPDKVCRSASTLRFSSLFGTKRAISFGPQEQVGALLKSPRMTAIIMLPIRAQ